MSMSIKDPTVTEKHIEAIRAALDYFDEVVLCVPGGLFELYNLSPARGDDRLYIHGVKVVPEDD